MDYIFDCGCRIDKYKIVKVYGKKMSCLLHPGSVLVQKQYKCYSCNSLFDDNWRGSERRECLSCKNKTVNDYRRRNNANRKLKRNLKKRNNEQWLEPKTKLVFDKINRLHKQIMAELI